MVKLDLMGSSFYSSSFLFFSDILCPLPLVNSKLHLDMSMEMDHIYFPFRSEPTYLPLFKQKYENSLSIFVSHQRSNVDLISK